MKKILIIGATSAMAEHCARLWVQSQSAQLMLVGRDSDRLEEIAADLRVRSPQSDIQVLVQADFLDVPSVQRTVVAAFVQGKVDIALIAHGSLPDQATCQTDLQLCKDTLEVNGVSPVLFAEAIATQMERANHGTLALIGSVAGDRGRKSNYVYGAAKGLVARYAQGLQHRFARSRVKVVLIKPGPTATPMTAYLKGMKMASVESVAAGIVGAVERGKALAYVPGKWAMIMMVIRHLPGIIFNKINI